MPACLSRFITVFFRSGMCPKRLFRSGVGHASPVVTNIKASWWPKNNERWCRLGLVMYSARSAPILP